MVEQWTHKPLVGGSNPPLAMRLFSKIPHLWGIFFLGEGNFFHFNVLCLISNKNIKKGGIIMRLTPPKKNVFWIATILAVLGILATFVSIPFVSAYAFWFVVVGFVLLWLGNAVKGF